MNQTKEIKGPVPKNILPRRKREWGTRSIIYQKLLMVLVLSFVYFLQDEKHQAMKILRGCLCLFFVVKWMRKWGKSYVVDPSLCLWRVCPQSKDDKIKVKAAGGCKISSFLAASTFNLDLAQFLRCRLLFEVVMKVLDPFLCLQDLLFKSQSLHKVHRPIEWP